ncbi:hypothetical protein BWQ96_09420 [Gracilariopsis chorda]|uniref:Uncharacterized protein n=1 Tax=Gracilariopsis chorda TaxID=448386 RepID=A0A2V3IFK9_9FLOR|nr:hypothetical protein BWQ96_09420 [Gracilariopsis chorda]|eukprot:PXF40875.1 hypothetical protein BWQ96_09420 [Gracilariopsis chorda]
MEMNANGYGATWRLGDIFMTAHAWLRRAARLERLQAETQELRINLAKVLQENMVALFQRITENLDQRFGLNLVTLTESEGSDDPNVRPPSALIPASGVPFKLRCCSRAPPPASGASQTGPSSCVSLAFSSSGAPASWARMYIRDFNASPVVN